MTNEEKRSAGWLDGTSPEGSRNSNLAGNSWYEQGYMEGVMLKVSRDVNRLRLHRNGGVVAGFDKALHAFFHELAMANDIKSEKQHFSYELDWENQLKLVAQEYVTLNKENS